MAISPDLNDREHGKFRDVDGSPVVAVTPVSGLLQGLYDYISVTYTTTSDTFLFKNGGVSGTTVATVYIQYTDSTKEYISTVEKT